jgi:hypothetical protein
MVKLKERTTIIPAALGTTFGITVKLIGSPAGERVNCWITWLHPKLTNPETGQASDRSEFPSRWPIGEVTPTGFTFETSLSWFQGRGQFRHLGLEGRGRENV